MQDYGGVSVLVVAAAAAPHLCTFDNQLQEGTVSWDGRYGGIIIVMVGRYFEGTSRVLF